MFSYDARVKPYSSYEDIYDAVRFDSVDTALVNAHTAHEMTSREIQFNSDERLVIVDAFTQSVPIEMWYVSFSIHSPNNSDNLFHWYFNLTVELKLENHRDLMGILHINFFMKGV